MLLSHVVVAVLAAFLIFSFRLWSHGRSASFVPGSSASTATPAKPSLDNPQHLQNVIREGIILAGGAAAILLQVAIPGVGKAIDSHSNFSYRPLDRLRTTMTFVYCMTFGTPQEKQIIVDMVHRAHAPVKGAGYSADEVHLQLWVAATLYAIHVRIYEDIFGPMDPVVAEALYHEYAVFAVSLRVPAEMWPVDRRAFWTYWDQQIERLEVTPEARRVAQDLLYNARLPLLVKMPMPWVRLIAVEMLPPRIREAYGFESTKLRAVAYCVAWEVTRVAYPLIPMYIRTYPMRYYLKDMRKRIERRLDRR
ncbi:hypothetical protein BO78DRAFT_398836 [Aspergillus sclerotiicarbonarius CBS 121057]|uniref:ER-bound oxygenase mpaB/mpaB'/Rubber oxygenase catalytic domain-containing protein n=1 Tax=Aspergillus sclerotiicarbonarius (strain CBS 121057 / IBT 28362) TaxID=1448318 RepID=A0A319FDL4_ASPSB|nr:hypothetical protein BO78DRAFT_398836 [Aspergillus sclerotiicarbonarius CBS 121057]